MRNVCVSEAAWHRLKCTVTSIREKSLNSASHKARKAGSIAEVVGKEREERVCGREEQLQWGST